MTDQSFPIGPQCQSHADFPRARARAAEHEVGDVATRDREQYERQNTQQAHQQWLIGIAIHAALQLGKDRRRH